MTFLAETKLWGTSIGAVAWDSERQCASFQYSAALQDTGIEPSPIMMPVRKEPYRFQSLNKDSYKGLPGMLADILPDKFGNALIDQWLARQGKKPSEFNPVERLCYIGQRGMGALEFSPSLGTTKNSAKEVDISAMTQLASDILQARSLAIALQDDKLNTEEMTQILEIGTSAGGARAKALIAWNKHTNSIRSGHLPPTEGYEYWLLKFDGVAENSDKELADPQGYGRIEYTYSKLAKAAEIDMTDCELIEEGGRTHFMTKRFDRNEKGEKLHMQTLCALGHYDYQLAGGTSYEQAFQACEQLNLPMYDKLQLFRRMVFNVVFRNQDDHTKNISFLMNRKGEWRLSPAYDMTYAYNKEGEWTASHQMSINGKRENIERSDLLEVAKVAGLNKKKCKDIINQMIDVAHQWPALAKDCDVSDTRIKKINNTIQFI